ncbi:helix-turn-helix domain-containing protein [Vibrio mediterranei]|uniref:helix-turn-helix domain-containing protein n=1 Tax=Vibrio mediterranei TaxID=689 RepID=UPI001EFE49F1|nr:helix-turn-helix transcriptional regulator [Vibrio mediterranei]MCG9624609.1 helix-turn-helix domain-containing protein [Vibrio mediterranei]
MTVPSWLKALKDEIDKPGNSQSKVAKQLGISTSKLSQTLRGVYPGSVDDIRIKVEGMYMTKTVVCPVKGQLLVNECADNQQRPFSSSNRERVRLYKACRAGCPHSSLEQTTKAKAITVVADEVEIYNTDKQLAFLEREARGSEQRFNDLLQAELNKLAAKYNQLVWKAKYQANKQ